MIRAFSAGLVLAFLASNAGAQSDPYTAQRAEYLRLVKNLYLAVGCKVVAGEPQILPMLSEQRRIAFGGPPRADPLLEPMIREAAQSGLAEAAQPEGCAFYSKDSNIVRYVRKATEEAYVRAIH
jgi:hypothetical protein